MRARGAVRALTSAFKVWPELRIACLSLVRGLVQTAFLDACLADSRPVTQLSFESVDWVSTDCAAASVTGLPAPRVLVGIL